jgi:hypothetical protein
VNATENSSHAGTTRHVLADFRQFAPIDQAAFVAGHTPSLAHTTQLSISRPRGPKVAGPGGKTASICRSSHSTCKSNRARETSFPHRGAWIVMRATFSYGTTLNAVPQPSKHVVRPPFSVVP